MIKNTVILVVLVGLYACTPSGVPSTTGTIDEDLSSLRPRYSIDKDTTAIESNDVQQETVSKNIEPSHHVTKELHAILDSIDVLRTDIKYIDGFTILVYSGTSNEQARIAKGKVFSLLPETSPELKFDEPNFRVKVGKYYSRLEAQNDYSRLKSKFPQAIIIPERIFIN